jgi:putative Ca2+/H+ antiporter (TMEM165/GDT1 family)
MLQAFLISFGVIFVAELGDKSQLMALAFATRFRPVPVLIGITVATAVVHAVSVGIGVVLGKAIPTKEVAIVAGIAFILFGLWTLRGDSLTDEDEERASRDSSRNTILFVGGVFFLAELGDKTMLATITLATREEWFGTWAGSTIGMVVADGLAIALGGWLGSRLPEKYIKWGAAAAFFIFGVLLLLEGLR